MIKKKNIRDEQGVSFVELMAVIAIIGILSAVALPSFLGNMPEKRLKNAARNLYSDLQRARLLAVNKNANITVSFNAAAGTYTYDTVTGRLEDYGAVRFGCDIATNDWNDRPLVAGTKTTFTGNEFRFSTGGLAKMRNSGGTFETITVEKGEGVLLQSDNDQSVCYAVAVSGFGSVRIWRYSNGNWD